MSERWITYGEVEQAAVWDWILEECAGDVTSVGQVHGPCGVERECFRFGDARDALKWDVTWSRA